MTWWQKKPYIDVINAYEKLTSREKNIVLSTTILALVVLVYLLAVEPMALNAKRLLDQQQQLTASNQALKEKISTTKNVQRQDPNAILRKELAIILQESKKIQENINVLTQALVAPRQMVSLLESVLTEDKKLTLVSLRNLPEEAISIDNSAADSALIYRHAFEIELEATYDSALAYLKRLDQLPWQLFWQDLQYESTNYPKGTLKIKIYTLSMSQEVLGV